MTHDSNGMLHFGGVRMALLDIQAGFWSIRRQIEALIGPSLTNSVLQQAGANGGASFARSFFSEKGLPPSIEFQACLQAYQAAGFGQFSIETTEWPLGRIVVRAQDTFEAWMVKQNGRHPNGPVCAYTSGVLVGFINITTHRRDVVCIERRCQAQGAEFCEFELIPANEAARDTTNGAGPVVALNPDPGITRQVNLLEMLFDRMPMGIAVLDQDFILRRCNPTWAAFIDQYAPPKNFCTTPGVSIFDLIPGAKSIFLPIFQRVLAGETIQQEALPIEFGREVSYWDIVLSPLYENEQVVGLLNVSIDATERVQTEQRLKETLASLEQRVEERTHELSTLLDVSQKVASTLDLDLLLGLILDQLKSVVDYAGASLMELKGDTLTILAYRGPIPPEQVSQIEFPFPIAGANQEVIRRAQPVVISDTSGDSPLAQAFRKTAGQQLHSTFGYIRCWMGVPLIVRDQVIGMLSLDHDQPGYYSNTTAQLVLAFANQAAVAIENAHLYEQATEMAALSERNRLARDLHDAVTQMLFSASLIAEVLPRLWARNPEMGQLKLEELRMLARGALSEMRTLLLELRPDTFVEVELVDLYRHLTNAFTGRTLLPVNFTYQVHSSLPRDVKETFYRIAQEALNNIAKHAQASQVQVDLVVNEGAAEVHIQDDGCGFDPARLSPQNLGLKIMHERATAIRAQVEINSAPGEGTSIRIYWQG